MNVHSPAILADSVSVRYGSRTAVDRVTLTVPRGSVSALLGRNGAGKSSLVRCILGQQKPEAGGVTLFGEDAWTRRAKLMDRIGVVAEESDAPPEMTVAQIADFSSRLFSRWDQAAVDARLRRFNINQAMRFGNLSKGQKKQVSLAMALATAPELLILDDPTLGLDVVAKKSLYDEVIGDLADRGTTILLATHDLGNVESIADRVAVLRDGQLVLDEEVETLKNRFRRIRFSSAPVALANAQLTAAAVRSWGSGTEAVVSNYDELLFERFRNTANVNTADVSPMSLEDIFIAIAGEQGAES
ncbi:MAG TPA: ABC transporter ATP-binding protein [Thermoanaerobaculia bacterium]|jgi:ABC-2 type transport system ATP-binding protein